jgi:hypothetical protein
VRSAPSPDRHLMPRYRSEAQAILDRAARRLLAARLDADAVRAAARTDDGAIDDGTDQSASLVQRKQVPVASAEGDRRRGGGD